MITKRVFWMALVVVTLGLINFCDGSEAGRNTGSSKKQLKVRGKDLVDASTGQVYKAGCMEETSDGSFKCRERLHFGNSPNENAIGEGTVITGNVIMPGITIRGPQAQPKRKSGDPNQSVRKNKKESSSDTKRSGAPSISRDSRDRDSQRGKRSSRESQRPTENPMRSSIPRHGASSPSVQNIEPAARNVIHRASADDGIDAIDGDGNAIYFPAGTMNVVIGKGNEDNVLTYESS